MGAPRQPTDEEKAKEQQRRLDEQAKWTNQQQWFSKFYTSDQKVLRSYWTRVEGAQSEEELKDIKDQIAQKAQASIGAVKGATYRITDGLFKATVTSKYHHRETNRNFFIELQDGVARPRPPLLESEFASHQALYMEKFNSVYGQIMDFMAVQCGYSKLVVDLPDMSPLMSQYDNMRMNALIALAKERGLELTFGPKVMDTLKDKPNDYARYTEALKEVNASAKLKVKGDERNAYEYEQAKKRLNGQSRSDGDKYGEQLKTLLEGKDGKASPIEKLNAFDKSVAAIEDRLNTLSGDLAMLTKHIDEYEKRVESAKDVSELDEVVRYIEDAKKQRAGLIEAMKVERADLQGKWAVLDGKNTSTISTLDIVAAEDGTPLKDEQKAAEKLRRDGMAGRLEKLSKGLEKFSDEPLAKIESERIANLKEKTEEKKDALQSAKPAGPGGA